MLFKDVIGQSEPKKHLVELVQHNRLSHALLFAGKEGSGALPLAMALAGYISLPNFATETPESLVGSSLFGNSQELPEKERTSFLSVNWDDPDDFIEKHPSYSKIKGMVHPD